MSCTDHLLMIRPVRFGFNAQTAVNNSFQKDTGSSVQEMALAEFDHFVQLLRDNNITVTVIDDTPEPHTPDSIFPNNWISFHEEETLVLYPMYAPNRRQERKATVLGQMKETLAYQNVIDLTHWEDKAVFLEGTGSMVLDRDNRIAYACLSERTQMPALEDFCERMRYDMIPFHSMDEKGLPVYHTNVMLCVADEYAVICTDSVKNKSERQRLLNSFAVNNKELVTISMAQMRQFAGNMLQVKNKTGEKLLIMSAAAHACLNKEQLDTLQLFNRIITVPLLHIETAGGGSARCMMAEIFF